MQVKESEQLVAQQRKIVEERAALAAEELRIKHIEKEKKAQVRRADTTHPVSPTIAL